MIELKDIIYFAFIILICYASWDLFNKVIFPKIVVRETKEIEKNPKWITSKLQHYYGLKDVNIILCESKWNALPRFRINDGKFELLIDNDITTNEVEDIGRLALAGKMHLKYGIWIDDKPLELMSVLCYMLDGGRVTIENYEWNNENKKPLD